MKPSPITDEQAWQLFELLEGNLSKTAAAELHQAMQGDANLKAHYEALAQTYLQPTTTLYPDSPSLKKKTSNRTVLFYASMSVAASLVILWFFKASIATQNIAPIQSQIAKTSPSVDKTTPSNGSYTYYSDKSFTVDGSYGYIGGVTWSFGTDGDLSVYYVRDTTNQRFYRLTLMVGNVTAYTNNFISIERLL